ncbi:MAG TPA: gamma-glutamyltransferase [Rhizomicrobium sp.]|jgi:gamma-glutamyltranspeptidase/glutathione hydrolase
MLRILSLAAVSAAVILTACSSGEEVIREDTGPHGSGYVVGDEPFAVRTGAAILAEGGSAADAAAGMYFSLSATYPVAAGLGGGGLCIVHDQPSGRTETFNFLARDAASGGPFAVPGNVKGFAAMQAAYGQLPWQRDVSPGEQFAATGFPISKALADRLATNLDVIRLDAGLAAEFLDESGRVKAPGTVVSNPALAQTLSYIRMYGPNGFYRGDNAAKIAAYTTGQSGAITTAELDSYAAGRAAPRTVALGSEIGYLPTDRIGSGAFTGMLLGRLVDANGNIIPGDQAAAATATATKAALDQFGISELPRDLGATGFAAVDGDGQAVSCAVTMNGPFGSGHTALGTGVTLARAPSSGKAGIAAAFLTPVIATDSSGSISLAGAGAGGPNGTAAIAYALVKLARGEDMTQPGAIRSTGIAPYDTVNVISCQGATCATLPDPQAHGLGAAAGQAPSGD